MEEPSIFIRVLQLGAQAGAAGVDENEINQWITNQPEVENEFSDTRNSIWKIFHESFERTKSGHGNPTVFRLKNEYYFRLIEFQELELSRNASISANRFSTVAIALSLLAIIASAIVGYMQITSSTQIQPSQISTLQNSIELSGNKINSEIESLHSQTKEQLQLQVEMLEELRKANKRIKPITTND